ncbi:MAG: ABC transporter ATP-binding protein [Candidatus Heimdallarchaeota archaeon]
MPDYMIEVKNLTKIFEKQPSLFQKLRGRRESQRRVIALDNLTFKVETGSFVGLLGPNGAGKTTLIKCLTTLLLPTSGDFRINNFAPQQSNEIKASIGAMLMGERGLYWKLTGRENLEYFSALYHVPIKESKDRIQALLDLMALNSFADRPVETYSSGQRMKFAFARAIVSDPPILILDEPTIAMDVQGGRELRKLVMELHQSGKTILYSTHIMSEIEELTTNGNGKVLIIDQGKKLAFETPEALKETLSQDEVIAIEGTFPEGEDLLKRIQKLEGVHKAAMMVNMGDREEISVLVDDAKDRMSTILDVITSSNGHITFVNPTEVSLEDVFINYTGRSLSKDTSVQI